jgi:glycosyltransferase involved in cell wall biosynthesis
MLVSDDKSLGGLRRSPLGLEALADGGHTMRGHAIQAVMAPDYSMAGNPYQKLLAQAVTAAGAPVTFLHSGHALLPLIRSLPRNRGTRQVFHLHWEDAFLGGKHFAGRLAWVAQFILDVALLRLRGWAIVWTVHNLYSHHCRYPQLERLARRALARCAHAVIVHCPRAGQLVRAEFGVPARKVTVIPHATYAGAYPDNVTRAEARRRLNLDATAKVFLYLGDIRPYKGVDNLCRAFAALGRGDTVLVLAGKVWQEMKGAVTSFSESRPNVRLFPGIVPDDDLQVYLRAADYYVAPYRAILTSGSIVLAKAFHTPVIAPDLGCVAQTLDCPPDVLYDPNAAGGLEQALERAVRQCERGEWRPSPTAGPTWAVVGERTREVYERALRAAGGV